VAIRTSLFATAPSSFTMPPSRMRPDGLHRQQAGHSNAAPKSVTESRHRSRNLFVHRHVPRRRVRLLTLTFSGSSAARSHSQREVVGYALADRNPVVSADHTCLSPRLASMRLRSSVLQSDAFENRDSRRFRRIRAVNM